MNRKRVRGFQSSFSGSGPGTYDDHFSQTAYNSDNHAAGPSEAPPSKRSRSQRDQHPVIDLTADQQPPLLMRSCADLRDPPLPRRERIEALRGLFARLDLTREVIENQVAGKHIIISNDIWWNYKSRAETRHSFDAKIDFWLEMDEALERNFGPECRTHVFGSMLNGFGSLESDVDIVALAKDGVGTAHQRLSRIRKMLRNCFRGHLSRDIELIPAKVPLLKFFYKDSPVDLSVNTDKGVRNTHLLFCYGQCDWRVRPLVCALKTWARKNGVNDAKNATLSSYVLTLLMINYLQILQPPVVPVLHDLHPELFLMGDSAQDDVFELPFLTPLPRFESENAWSLGQLFAGFMQHYDRNFDFTADVASVRTGRILNNAECAAHARSVKLGPGQWRAYVCVEEPFERSNAARAVCRRDSFDDILYCLDKANRFGNLGKRELFNC